MCIRDRLQAPQPRQRGRDSCRLSWALSPRVTLDPDRLSSLQSHERATSAQNTREGRARHLARLPALPAPS
eukprot:3256815-Prorocentrum_lima.AAC.1